MKKITSILAATTLFSIASAANAAYVVTGSGQTTVDSNATVVATQTVTGTATVTLAGGNFDSMTFDIDIDTFSPLLNDSAIVSSTTTFDSTGASTTQVLSCTGNFLICNSSGAGDPATSGSVINLDFSDLNNITWSSLTPKDSPLGPSTVSLSFTAVNDVAEVPVPAAVWLFGSALAGLAGVGRKRKAI